MAKTKSKCLGIGIIALLAIATTISGIAIPTTALAYKQSQAGSLANACGNRDFAAFNVLCQNLASEIQGDKNAVNIIGEQAGGNLLETPPVAEKATLTVIKNVVCQAGVTCSGPSAFHIKVSGTNPIPEEFDGSSTPGTQVELGAGTYSVDETAVPPLPAGQILSTSKSPDCSGTIAGGESKTCTITNTITIQAPSTGILRVIKQVTCPSGLTCPPTTEFKMTVTGNSPNPATFDGSSTGTDVQLGPGTYSVSETHPATLPGLDLTESKSPDCIGTIAAGETKTCTVTNAYTITNPNGDDDGDNLRNSWEILGIDENGDGIIDFVLPGANPLHKDQYMEIDYMQFHQPIPQAVTDVITSFSNAPLTNPDGIPGITLHVIVDEQILHAAITDCHEAGQDGDPTPCHASPLNPAAPTLLDIKGTNFGTAAERVDPNAANIIAAKAHVFHYALFAHSQSDCPPFCSSGISNGIPGMEFLVTLGGAGWGDPDGDGHPSGSQDQQAGTIMHEFGHNLNLRHGGGDNINCKPNYLSVMSYTRQFSNWIATRPLDYSRSQLAILAESNLNEPNGISASTPPGLITVYGPVPPGPGFVAAGNPVDWNFNGVTTDVGVASNINGDLACGTTGAGEVLNGFDDWNAGFVFQTAGAVLQQSTSPEQPREPELTINDVRHSRIVLLDGIRSAIERLQVEPSGPNAIIEGEGFDLGHIAELLQSDQLADAIAELNGLKDQVIGTFGLEASQREVIPMIDNLVQALEKQM